jgi:8-amino-7-oxononanoate synthase
MSDIAIVGVDCRFPQAPTADALWTLLMDGADGVGDVPTERWQAGDLFDPAGGPGTVNNRSGGFVRDADAFDHEFFAISPREAEAMDPQQRLLLQAAWRALEDATLDPRAQAGSRTGVFVGVMGNEWAHLHMRDLARITPQLGAGNGYFMTANRVSYQLDLKGPSLAVDTACSSSLTAVHLACNALRAGECDQALAGGVNLMLTPALSVFYTQAGLSAPDGRCKPFSGRADGIGRGEGVAVLALRRLDDAVAAGLPVYAVIKAGAVNSDGRSNGITAPSRWSQQDVVAAAYRRAGVRPEQVAFVEAHGTGTLLGDLIEVKALGHLHAGRRTQPCAIGSIKGNLGHTEAAAGIAGVIKAALALRHRVVPPSRYAADENPRLKLAEHGLRLLTEPLELPATGEVHAGVSSFGLGGSNAHLLLASGPPEPPGAVRPADRHGGVLTLSAPDAAGLRRNAARLAEHLAAQPADQLAEQCWTSNQVKSSGRARVAIPVRDREQAVTALRELSVDDTRPAGVTTGWLFTGQGSQYPGMSQALHEASGAYRRALSDVDDEMSAHLGGSVRDLVLRGRDSDRAVATRTGDAQPAIFAMQYALARVLVEAGLEPAWLLGHSVGEYAAATLAGVLDLADACRLIAARGRLMQALPAGGAMASVHASHAEVAELLADEPAVELAAVNGPDTLVLSGAAPALEAVVEQLVARGAAAKALNVSHAFHSPLVEPMLDAFAEVASTITYRQPKIPIYSTLRGRLLDEADSMDAAYWTEQIRSTVRFSDALAAAVATGPTHLVEVGPRRVLAPLANRIRPDLPCLAPCPGPNADGSELTGVIAALYRDGLNPDWDVLYEPEQRVRRRLPGYEFSTEHRFWVQADPASHARTESNQVEVPPAMNDIITLFREQNAILAAMAAAQENAPTTVDAERAGRDPAALVLEQVAVVSGHPVAALKGTQTLADDLGFDSIMVVELATRVGRACPELAVKPRDFNENATLGDVIASVTGRTDVPEPPEAERPPAAEEHRIEEFPEVKAMADRLRDAEAAGVTNPYFLVNDGVTRDTSVIDGRQVLNFSSYNYLGLSGHPAVVLEVQHAVARYGSSCSASRMISGEKPVHRDLEAEIAALLGSEDALAMVSGHATNVTVIGHLVGPDDLVVHDSLAHNSILQGCQLSGATRRPFPHNDHAALDSLLTAVRHRYRRVLILIEGVYSQDGDIPDLPAFIEVKKKHRALMMIDEAHSIGVLGATGGGIGEHFGVRREDVELWSGTMSKALAGCGGYVAGSHQLVQYLKYTAPGFIYSVGITPPNAAASLAAIRQLRAEPGLVTRLRERGELFLRLAEEAGLDTGESLGTPVIPCIVGDSLKAIKLSNALLAKGTNVNPILYPAVPEERARLRFFVTVDHTEEQIRGTVRAVADELAALA